MRKREKQSRKYCHKALTPIRAILEKYPEGINDIHSISEETRAWIQIKVQQFRECIKQVYFLNKPVWWEAMRISRNKIAHQEEDLSDSVLTSILSTVSSNLSKIEYDLNTNIKRYRQDSKKKRRFENLTSSALGSESEKKQFVDAMEEYTNPNVPEDIRIEFPKNKYSELGASVLKEISSQNSILEYERKHAGLSENIQTDILEWLEKVNKYLVKEDPFREEAFFIEQQKQRSSEDIACDLIKGSSKMEYHYKRLPSVSDSKRGDIEASSVNFDFFHNQFLKESKLVKSKNEKGDEIELLEWKSVDKLEILKRNIISDLEQSLVDRKSKWELAQIDSMRKEFLEKLYAKINKFMKLERLLMPFIKNLGRLWDLSEGTFETSGFEILDTFAKLLEHDESLKELADLLGKQTRAQISYEKELRDKVVIKSSWQPKHAYKGEINGLRFSNDISAVLPSELSLMDNPAANKLFQLKFAQKQLLSYDYQRLEEEQEEYKEKEEKTVEKKEPKGPIIICVDTSGSMHGTPENIAKTITFALSKIAIEEERKCYLISFSTNIETLDLTDFTNNPIGKLVQFLRMSFHGGTDAAPALKHAVKMLSENKWKNSDVLMISDFVMQSLDNDIKTQMESAQENNTNFHSLVIGNSGNNAAINSFDHNWFYDANNPQANRHLVEQIHEIRTHNSLANA
ncbi:VWA domain-containing protein [Treponema sp.]|uniref:VWA domain-containing protein n=1 Tax=Treponema sp. TaxID=166 RepID=UPI003FD78B97